MKHQDLTEGETQWRMAMDFALLVTELAKLHKDSDVHVYLDEAESLLSAAETRIMQMQEVYAPVEQESLPGM